MRKIIGIVLLGIITAAWGQRNCDRLPSNVNYNVWPIAKDKVIVFEKDTFSIINSKTPTRGNRFAAITYNDRTYFYTPSNLNGKEEIVANGTAYLLEDQYSIHNKGDYGGFDSYLWIAPDTNRNTLLLIQIYNDRVTSGLNLFTFDVSQDIPVRIGITTIEVPDLLSNIYAYYDGTNNWLFAGNIYSEIYVWKINSNFTLSDPQIYNQKENINPQVSQTSRFYIAPTGDHIIFEGGGTGNPLLQFWDFDKITGKLTHRMTKRSYLFYENCKLFSTDGTKIYHDDEKTFLQTDLSDGKYFEGEHYYKDDVDVTQEFFNYQYIIRKLAPNGKMYSFAISANNSMEALIDVIGKPNEIGESINVRQKIVTFNSSSAQIYNSLIPTFPIPFTNDKSLDVTSTCLDGNAKIVLKNRESSATTTWQFDETNLELVQKTSDLLELKGQKSGEYEIKATTSQTTCEGITSQVVLVDTLKIGIHFDFDVADITIGSSCETPVAKVNVPEEIDEVVWSFTSSTDREVNIGTSGEYFVDVNKNGCWERDTFQISIADKVGKTRSNSRIRDYWVDGGVSFTSTTDDFVNQPGPNFQGYTYFTNAVRTTICNEQGVPLFHTDGDYFWKTDGTLMNNGGPTLNQESGPSGYSKPFILPHPGNDQQYYVFTHNHDYTLPFNSAFSGTLYYDLVDISQGPKVIEKKVKFLTACPGMFDYVLKSNGKDYWFIAHSAGYDFKIYSLDKNGFNWNTPLTQTIGNYFDKKNTVATSILLEGDLLYVKNNNDAFNRTDITERYNFDRTTGKLSNRKVMIGIPFPATLSPSGRFAYTYEAANDFKRYTFQYDMFLNTPQEISASRTLILNSNVSDNTGRSKIHKLAPNGKIYIHEGNNKNLSVIDNPDKKGPDVGYRLNGTSINLGFLHPFTFDKHSFSRETSIPEIVTTNNCEGKTTTIGTVNDAAVSSWDIEGVNYPSATSLQLTFATSGTKNVKLNYIGGCSDEKSLADEITIYKAPETVVWDTTLCGDDLQLDAGNEGYTYSWKDANNQELGTSQKLSITNSGEYKVLISNEGCAETSQYTIDLEKLPALNLNTNNYICPEEGDEITLNPGNQFKKYEWINEGLVNQSLTVDEIGTYPLRLYGDSICVTDKNIEVIEECPPVVHLPNAFSPNGDGLNDLYTPLLFYVKEYEITILSEWGEVVFYSNDVKENWDGIYRNELAPTGAYACVVKYISTQNGEKIEKEISKSITLIR